MSSSPFTISERERKKILYFCFLHHVRFFFFITISTYSKNVGTDNDNEQTHCRNEFSKMKGARVLIENFGKNPKTFKGFD